MPSISSVCDHCGKVRPNAINLGPGWKSLGTNTFIGMSFGTCECGGTLRVPNMSIGQGTITLLGDAFKALRQEHLATDQAEALLALIRQARTETQEPQSVADRIERIAPELGRVVRERIVPKDPGQFWTMMGVIIMVLLWYLSREEPAEPPTTIINYFEAHPESVWSPDTTTLPEEISFEPESSPPSPRAPAQQSEVKGRDRSLPCPCGNGRKYKKCHGNPAIGL